MGIRVKAGFCARDAPYSRRSQRRSGRGAVASPSCRSRDGALGSRAHQARRRGGNICCARASCSYSHGGKCVALCLWQRAGLLWQLICDDARLRQVRCRGPGWARSHWLLRRCRLGRRRRTRLPRPTIWTCCPRTPGSEVAERRVRGMDEDIHGPWPRRRPAHPVMALVTAHKRGQPWAGVPGHPSPPRKILINFSSPRPRGPHYGSGTCSMVVRIACRSISPRRNGCPVSNHPLRLSSAWANESFRRARNSRAFWEQNSTLADLVFRNGEWRVCLAIHHPLHEAPGRQGFLRKAGHISPAYQASSHGGSIGL